MNISKLKYRIVSVFVAVLLSFLVVNGSYKTASAMEGVAEIDATLAGLSAAQPELAPFLLIAAALITTGAVVVENKDQILALAEYIKEKAEEGGGWFGSQVEQAWFDIKDCVIGANQLIITPAIKNILSALAPTIPQELTWMIPSHANHQLTGLLEAGKGDIMSTSYSGYFVFSVPSFPDYIFYVYNAVPNLTIAPTITTSADFATCNFAIDQGALKGQYNNGRSLGLLIYSIAQGAFLGNLTATTMVNDTTATGTISTPAVPSCNTTYNQSATLTNTITLYNGKTIKITSSHETLTTSQKLIFTFPSTFTGAIGAQEYMQACLYENRDAVQDANDSKAQIVTTNMSGVNAGKDKYDIMRALDNAFADNEIATIAMDVPLSPDDANYDATAIPGIMTGTNEISDKEITTVDGVQVEAMTTEMTESITDMSDSLANILVPPIFGNTLAALQNMDTSRGEPPKIKINLHALMDAGVSKIAPEVVNQNTLPDEESDFVDFDILNKWSFGGMSLIDYFRMIVGFGMIIFTFSYIWRRLMPKSTFSQ